MKAKEMSLKRWFWKVGIPVLALLGMLLLTGCDSQARVGELRNEKKSVELGNAQSVKVEVNLGAGHLLLNGGAEKLMEADFTYNVDKIKPGVKYTDGTLVVQQPETSGMPALLGISGFRNEWNVSLNDVVPMDLSLDVGAGSGDMVLTGLSLNRLDITLGAGIYTVDLSGDWAKNLDVTIDAGAATVTLKLPKDVGARVKVEEGPHTIEAPGLVKDGPIYTNSAYGVSDVTMQIDLQVGIGMITMEVEGTASSSGSSLITMDLLSPTHLALEGTGANQFRCGQCRNEMLAGRSAYAADS